MVWLVPLLPPARPRGQRLRAGDVPEAPALQLWSPWLSLCVQPPSPKQLFRETSLCLDSGFESLPGSKDLGSLMVVLLLCVGGEHLLRGTSVG